MPTTADDNCSPLIDRLDPAQDTRTPKPVVVEVQELHESSSYKIERKRGKGEGGCPAYPRTSECSFPERNGHRLNQS